MENSKQRRARKARETEADRVRLSTLNGYMRMKLEQTEAGPRESPCVIGKVKPSSRDGLQTMDGYGDRAATEWVNANIADGNMKAQPSDADVAKLRKRIANAGNAQTVKRSTVSPKTPDEIAAQRGKHKSTGHINPWRGCIR